MTVLRDQIILFGSLELTGTANSVSLQAGVEAQDKTKFGNQARQFKKGLYTVSAEAEGEFSADPHDQGLYDALGLEDTPFSVLTGGDAGDVAYTFKAMEGDYTPLQNSVGELIGYSMGAVASGDLVRGRLLIKASTLASDISNSVEMGAVQAAEKLCAVLHVLSLSEGGAFDAEIVSDADDTMASPVTQITFDTMEDVGSQWKEVSGPITDEWFAVDYTVSGTVSFAVLLGKN